MPEPTAKKTLLQRINSLAARLSSSVVDPLQRMRARRPLELVSTAEELRGIMDKKFPSSAQVALLVYKGFLDTRHVELMRIAREEKGATHVVVVLFWCEAQFKTLNEWDAYQPDIVRDIETIAATNLADAVYVPRCTTDVFYGGLGWGVTLIPNEDLYPKEITDEVQRRILLCDFNILTKMFMLTMPRYVLLDYADKPRRDSIATILRKLTLDDEVAIGLPDKFIATSLDKKGQPVADVVVRSAPAGDYEKEPLKPKVREPEPRAKPRYPGLDDQDPDDPTLDFETRLDMLATFHLSGRMAIECAGELALHLYYQGEQRTSVLLENVRGALWDTPEVTKWSVLIYDPRTRLATEWVDNDVGALIVFAARVFDKITFREGFNIPACKPR